ncbi:MAG: glycosyltransferase [Methanocellales archaeon]|nr:glycosyltransferase [Methanocellales archaeon]
MRLSIILPAHNEANTLPELVEQLISTIDKSLYEIIIVDDCSTDQTPQISHELSRKYDKVKVIHRKSSPGLGNAIKTGLKTARGSHILLMDADGEMRPEDVPKMIDKAKKGYDVVIGSRFIKGSKLVGYSRKKLVMNRLYNLVFAKFLRTKVKDLTFGFKILSREVVGGIAWEAEKHGIAAETTVKPIVKGYRAVEVPACWTRREKGSSKFHFSYNFEYIKIGVKGVYAKWMRR